MFSARNASGASTLPAAIGSIPRPGKSALIAIAAALCLLPITAVIYVIEISGSQFVPVFWYLYLPIIGLTTYRYGLARGLGIAGLCCLLVTPIVVSELAGSGLTLNAGVQLSTVSLFLFAAGMTSYLVHLQHDLERKVDLVSSEKEKTQGVLEAITDVVCTTDLTCRVVSINGGTLGNRAVDPGPLLGQTLCHLFSPADEKGNSICPDRCPVRTSAADRVVSTSSAHFTSPNGARSRVPVMWKAAPLPDDPQQEAGVVSVVRDMSRDEELGRLKGDFVSMVSHELRSPLTNMSAAIEILQVGPATRPKRQELLATVQSEVLRLSRFVEEILDAEKIERGALPLNHEPVSLPPIASRVVRQFQRRSTGHRFELAWEPDLPFVLADTTQIERVIHNLVANAVSYSRSRTAITIDLTRDEDAVSISVSDAGMGIPADRLDSVFDRFYRAHTKDSQDVYGYGLGLYICKQLVEAQGGEIRVESAEGLGSTFTVTLPILRTDL